VLIRFFAFRQIKIVLIGRSIIRPSILTLRQLSLLPCRQGFDYYFGIPYSDDMVTEPGREHWPPLPLIENERVIEAPPDQNLLTKRYTENAIELIKTHRDQPFFLVLIPDFVLFYPAFGPIGYHFKKKLTYVKLFSRNDLPA